MRSVLLKWFLRLTALGVVAGMVVAALFAGFFIAERDVGPSNFLGRVEAKLHRDGILPRSPGDPLVNQEFSSHLLQIQADGGVIAIGDPNNNHSISENGGGMTSFGEDVLLLPYDGRVYAASSGSNIRATEVFAPDNGRDAYHALADDPEYAAFDIRKGYLRYNDLAAFNTGSEKGLLASYTEFHADKVCATNTIAKFVFEDGVTSIDQVSAGKDDWEIIYRSSPCIPFKDKFFALEGHMAGGRMAMADANTVVLTNGDFHLDAMRSDPKPGPIAQDASAHYGKVVSVDLTTNEDRILTMGHRNQQGLDVLPDGRIILAEHGPRGGDEINIIRESGIPGQLRNYGWPYESFGTTYDGASPLPNSVSFGRHDTFEQPIYSWVPSVAISSLTYVDGFSDLWDGDVLVASLIDRSLHRLRLEGDRVLYSERIQIGARIRDVHQHTDGRLVLWTDNQDLVFLTAVERVGVDELFARYVDKSNISARLAEATKEAVANCGECHSYSVGDNEKAPSLANVFGDAIGSTDYVGYSDALSGHGGIWTADNLLAFVQNPDGFAPGTYMGANVEDAEVANALVGFLEMIDNSF